MSEKEPTKVQKYNQALSLHTLPICSRAQLSRFNGVDKPQLYVAIRGLIYDVSENIDKYGVGKSYHNFVGKDVSRCLGQNRLTIENDSSDGRPDWDCSWDTTHLTEQEQAVVDKWVLFFQARYKIVGLVVDHSQSK